MSATQPQTPQRKDNATWLFEYPPKDLHNSEQWWSSLFSMFVLHLGAQSKPEPIAVYQCNGEKDWRFTLARDRSLDCTGLKYDEVFVEQKLHKDIFELRAWPDELGGVSPDILIVRRPRKTAILIENKTIRATFNGQIERYLRIVNHLCEQGWSARFLPLISCGYEVERERRLLQDLDVILWEDVLRRMDKMEHFRALFDHPLRTYYENAPHLAAQLE